MVFQVKFTGRSLLVLGMVTSLASAVATAAPEMDGPYIVNDLEAARAQARQTGKPLFVVFRCER